jgi:hypothetical protein
MPDIARSVSQATCAVLRVDDHRLTEALDQCPRNHAGDAVGGAAGENGTTSPTGLVGYCACAEHARAKDSNNASRCKTAIMRTPSMSKIEHGVTQIAISSNCHS